MLRWEEENGVWSAYDDARIYRVFYTEEYGWEYQYLLDDSLDGMYGYNTAEEAMAGAEKNYKEHDLEIDWEDLEPLDLEDLEDAYWDEVAHERMEIAKGLSW